MTPGDASPATRAAPARRRGDRVASALFRPVRTRRTFEDVIGQIIDLVQSGQLQEQDVLPGERALADAMDVSRATVRLAVGTLADAGVLRVRPGRAGGIEVASIWIPVSVTNLEAALPADEVFSVLEARRALEPRVAQLAAMRATGAHFEAMERSIELQRAHGDELPKALQAQTRFHRIMWQASGNVELESMLVALFRRLAVVMDMLGRTDADSGAALQHHRDTLTALKRGGAAQIDAAMDAHLGYLESITEEALGRRRMRPIPAFLQGE